MIQLQIPGSKSITNRALLIAALAKEKSTLTNALESDDTRYMQKTLRSLGTRMKKKGDSIIIWGGNLRKAKRKLFCGNAGTAMRFLTAVLATQPFESLIDGDSRMRQRPIEDLLDALRQLGAEAYARNGNGCPPVKVRGPLRGSTCYLKGNVSSQFLSGLLIAAPLAKRDITIHINGDLVSKPYIDMTIEIMRRFGVPVQRNVYKKFAVRAGQHYQAQHMEIEGDASSATYFWGISALTREKIEITNVPKDSKQPDVRFLLSLRAPLSGAKQSRGQCEKRRDCFGLRPRNDTTINCSDFPDSAMTLAVLCALGKGKTKLTGLANLRLKESDRLHALATELHKIGARVKELKDGLVIRGDPEKLHGALIETYNDHRIAMCFGMLSVVIPGIKVKNPGCVTKTYPNFWKDLARIKKHLSEKNIILTGMRGSGKTEIGKLLAKKLKRRFIDIDEEIERHARMSIPEIVKRFGWGEFRKRENTMVKKVSRFKKIILSTGGGTLMRHTNEKLLKKNGKAIFLKCAIPVLIKRLTGNRDRPSLTGRKSFLKELNEIYKKREQRYRDVADAMIDVSGQTKNRKSDLQKKTERILTIVHILCGTSISS